MKRLLKILHAADGKEITDQIEGHFQSIGTISIDRTATHQEFETGLVLFVLTEEAAKDLPLQQTIKRYEEECRLILPIVWNLDQFDFKTLPVGLEFLGTYNLKEWSPDAAGSIPGEAVIATIESYLGETLFDRDKKLFVSYRREDGSQIADWVYQFFTNQGFRVFLDTQTLEGGDDFQYQLAEEIRTKDLILLIDSPQAKTSEYVREELLLALSNRIPVIVLESTGGGGIDLTRDARRLPFTDQNDLPKLEALVRKAIHEKATFDQQVIKAIKRLSTLKEIRYTRMGPRQMKLTWPENQRGESKLFEFESNRHSLERIYRLAQNYEEWEGTVQSALLIHGGENLPSFQKEAIEWAVRDEPLQVHSLREFLASIYFT